MVAAWIHSFIHSTNPYSNSLTLTQSGWAVDVGTIAASMGIATTSSSLGWWKGWTPSFGPSSSSDLFGGAPPLCLSSTPEQASHPCVLSALLAGSQGAWSC